MIVNKAKKNLWSKRIPFFMQFGKYLLRLIDCETIEELNFI